MLTELVTCFFAGTRGYKEHGWVVLSWEIRFCVRIIIIICQNHNLSDFGFCTATDLWVFCLSGARITSILFWLSARMQLIIWKDSSLKWPVMYQVGHENHHYLLNDSTAVPRLHLICVVVCYWWSDWCCQVIRSRWTSVTHVDSLPTPAGQSLSLFLSLLYLNYCVRVVFCQCCQYSIFALFPLDVVCISQVSGCEITYNVSSWTLNHSCSYT